LPIKERDFDTFAGEITKLFHDMIKEIRDNDEYDADECFPLGH